MRIFAFVLWHHFAFLVISIAILGFGAGGAVLASVRRLREADFRSSVAIACLAFTVSTFIGPMSLSAIDIFGKMGARELVAVAGQYLVFALPYFFAGYVISIVLMHEARAVDRFYFVNMLGSGVGCFVLFATLEPLGAEGSLCVIAVLGALGAVLVAGPRLRIFAVVATLGCLGLLTAGDSLLEFRVAESKLLATAERLDRKHLAGTWTPLARLDVYEEPTVGGAVLFQDGDAPAFMPGTQHRYPDSEIHSVSYVVSERPNVLIIGVGGGLDVKWALEKQARSIVGVEINARTLDYYTDDFKSITGYRKSQPDLELHVAEGRHFVGSSERSFDLIQMSGVDTYTALSSGAYVLSESYLYTEEAFHDYLAHLTPDGLFSFIRFAFPVPRETLRVMVIACKVLADRGVPEPWRHVVVIKQPTEGESTSLGAILVKKSPFSEDELARLVAWTDAHHYTREYLPGESGKQSPFHDFAEKLADGQAEEFLDSYPYEVRPVQDDRPFFFSQHRLSTVWTWLRDLLSGSATRELPENVPWVALLRDFQTKPVGLMLLVVTLVQLAALVSLCIFAPLLRLRAQLSASVAAPLGYFLCLGLAYILLMISAMQRFSLILGHPSYAISVTMATFLIASAAGSLVSGRCRLQSATRLLAAVAVLLVLFSLLLQLFLPAAASFLLRQSFGVCMLATIALLAPMAFLMGMCFPTGIRMLGDTRKALIPWAYGVNGAASVLGSVLAVCFAMLLGFTNVQWIAVSLYCLAAWLMRRMALG